MTGATMKEYHIEQYLVKMIKHHKGEIRKVQWIGRAHAMDRFVALNGVWLVELKRPKGVERPGQIRERIRLTKHGVRCRVINSLEGVDEFIAEVLSCV